MCSCAWAARRAPTYASCASISAWLLGTGANMEELRRTKAGPFREDETLVTLHQLKDAYVAYKETGDESGLRRVIQPVETALSTCRIWL